MWSIIYKKKIEKKIKYANIKTPIRNLCDRKQAIVKNRNKKIKSIGTGQIWQIGRPNYLDNNKSEITIKFVRK